MKRTPKLLFFATGGLLLLLLMILVPTVSMAGFGGGGSIGDPGCDPFDPECPIDGGLSLLIAAGIGLGARKAYQRKKAASHS
jgi:hypothetical protein